MKFSMGTGHFIDPLFPEKNAASRKKPQCGCGAYGANTEAGFFPGAPGGNAAVFFPCILMPQN
jgi:hypothetical protein